MRTQRVPLLLTCVLLASSHSGPALAQHLELGTSSPFLSPGRDDAPPCDGALLTNTDEQFENAYAWDDPGVEPPDFGGFADAFVGSGVVCGMRVYLTTLPLYFNDEIADAYVYTSDGTNPDVVLSVTPGIEVGTPGIWPEISVHEIELAPASVDGEFFVYFWGDFEDGLGWYVAADVRGPIEAKPRTKVPWGIGYPTGWLDVDDVWGDTDAMGLCAYVLDDPVPVVPTTWGAVKRLYFP
ncbi:MAG: hypothetical protein R3E97_24310 [Candidatus Eisenbacteria bacterium]